jgi:hypothetical protein
MSLSAHWRVANHLKRLAAWPYIRIMFALHGVAWGRNWRVFGMPILQCYRGSRIVLGDGLELRSWLSANPLAPNHAVVLATLTPDATIRVGQDCGFTGTTLVSAASIEIGNRVLVGANATIVDTDFHPLTPEGRRQDTRAGRSSPILIGDDVFIGMNALILKGVTIGGASVIGAGSVVVKDVPAGVIVAGNPARIVRDL